MRKNLLKPLSLGLITTIASMQLNAQNVPIDWEPGGNGAAWTWNVFENATNPPVSIVANPSATGINTSANVMCMTALQTGQPYAGVESAHGNIGSFTLSNSNAIVKVMVYKSVISDVGVKFAIPSGGALVELKQPNTLINQWEELTFDFSGRIGDPNTINMDQIIFFPDFNARTSDNICYFDNITFSAVTTPTAPTMGAPVPTAAPANVISLFSNTFTNIPMSTFATGWSAVAASDVVIAGNDTKLYSNLNFVGIEPAAQIDATAMNTFNIDVWTPNSTAFRVKLVDFGPNGIYLGGDDVEHEVSLTPTLNGWNSYHIPLSNFTNLTTKANIAQLILSSNPSGTSTIYADNMYFSYEPPIVPMIAAPTPTAAPADVISMFSNAYTDVPVDTWRTPWSQGNLTDLNIAGNPTKRYNALNFVGIETVGANLIDASTMTNFNIDVWTPNMTAFRVKLVDWGANGVWNGGGVDDTEHEIVLTPTLSGWNTYSLPLTDFTNLANREHISQLILSGLPVGLGDVYVDNVYFSKVLAPLAINITAFMGTVNNNIVNLSWNAASEENLAYYEVEKSTNNGATFTSINKVMAKKEIANSYQVADFLSADKALYRLRMTDANNAVAYSNAILVKNNSVAQDITITPNPSSNNISINSNTKLGTISIVNSFGQIVFETASSTNSVSLDISAFTSGTYFIKTKSGALTKFIKN
jgi:hypothetical protein